MSEFSRRLLAGAFALLAAPLLRAQSDLRIDIRPRSGTVEDVFLITISNGGPEDFVYDDCCTYPRILSLRDGSDACCPNCPKGPCFPGGGLLPAGGSREFEWKPAESGCIGGPPRPGIYEVAWTNFPGWTADRLEILPSAARSIAVAVDPAEVPSGKPVKITATNTSGKSLIYEGCCYPPAILGPAGGPVLCVACIECTRPEILAPGASLDFTWTPGEDLCTGALPLPGRHRVIWGGFRDDASDTPIEFTGAAEVLVLPPEERRLDLALSASEVLPGGRFTVIATNPLDFPVLHAPRIGCKDLILLDALGFEPTCMRCSLAGAGGAMTEIPPGGTMSTEVVVPVSGFCGASHPGRWTVIWGRYFEMGAGPDAGKAVYGHAGIDVVEDAPEPNFIRGDCDRSGSMDLTDAIALLEMLFMGGKPPPCPDACDGDDTGVLDLTDAIYSLSFQFMGGRAPPAPYPAAGTDPTPDALGCAGR